MHAVASPPGAPTAPAQPSTDWEDLFGSDDDQDTGCSGAHGSAAAPGVQHYEAAEMTGGLTFPICEAEFGHVRFESR